MTTIYLSNFASHRTPGAHGPGRKLSIMAAPRAWEHGEGVVTVLVPALPDLRAAKAGAMEMAEYRARFERRLVDVAKAGALDRGGLLFEVPPYRSAPLPVADGDTLCCACSIAEARAGRCHRAWAAPYLRRAGWRVVLDGVSGGAP